MNKRNLVTFAFLFFSLSLIAQKKTLPSAPKENVIVKRKDFKPTNISDRLNEYPFNAAVKVRIVSFNLDYDGELVVTPIGSTEITEKGLPINLSNIVGHNNLPGFAQSKTLTLIEVIKLSDILYNVCPKYIISRYTKLGCYEPRNAILFYDENDQVFQYIEICFECRENETKPKNLNILDNFCSYGYDELKMFFEKNGINTK